jgi:hypothetical protein
VVGGCIGSCSLYHCYGVEGVYSSKKTQKHDPNS